MRISPSTSSYADTLWACQRELQTARIMERGGVRDEEVRAMRLVGRGEGCDGAASSVAGGKPWPKLGDVLPTRALGEAPAHRTHEPAAPAKDQLGRLIDVFG
ncbi:MAG: hypothetical protein AAGH64_07955 [Planctomycetota bacterium]